MNLLKVDTVEGARNKIEMIAGSLMPRKETAGLLNAAGRVLAEDIFSGENIPQFRRSTVDGYAVRSRDVGAAGDMIPTFLRITGEVLMGEGASDLKADDGCCIYVPTGGAVPDGADAVVMVEYCESFGDGMLAVSKSASAGENIVQAGEDIKQGEILLKKGRKLRAQDIGVLAAAGITAVPVFVPWRVSIISTGDELISPAEKPEGGQIRDINTYAVAARCLSEGFTVVRAEALKDERDKLLRTLQAAGNDSDIVVISGGSSQGKKDMTASLIDEVCDCGVLTHGISAKPGKPTITGFDRNSVTLFIGLPGHPAAALMVFEQILIRFWHELTTQNAERTVRARITANVPSAPGRRTYQLVTLSGADGAEAVPIFARSGMISPMSTADGYFEMSENQEGVRAGDTVDVHLWK